MSPIAHLRTPPLMQPVWAKWLAAQITDADRKLMRQELHLLRDIESLGLAPMLLYMNEVGEHETISKKDIGIIQRGLLEARAENKGVELARAHFFMRGIGIGEKIKEGDKDIMQNSLREAKTGGDLAAIHYYMHSIGEGEAITEKDSELIREKFLDARGKGKGLNLASLHFYMHGIGQGENFMREDTAIIAENGLPYARKTESGLLIARFFT